MSVQPEDVVVPAWLRHGPWTEAEFLALPEDLRRVQLLDGELLMSPSPSSWHQELSSRIWLALHLAHPAGLRVIEAVDVRVGPGRILVPDIVVVRAKPGQNVTMWDAADVLLALEIASPGSVAADRAIKPRLYAEAGIPLYVRVELGGPSAVVHRLAGSRYGVGTPASVLHLTEPFPAAIDLAAVMVELRGDG